LKIGISQEKEDVQSLKKIFEGLGFSIDTCIDKTEEGIKDAISQFKSSVLGGKETCDMIVIVIMSHGGDGESFFTFDKEKIKLDYILKYTYIWILGHSMN